MPTETIAYLEAVVGADVSDFRRGMREVRGDLSSIGDAGAGIRDIGRDLTLALTVPLIIAGTAALNTASQFDSSMRNINSILGANETQFQSLSKAVLDYGSTIRAGPIAASEALYQIVSAGITDQVAAMQILQVANATAEAGQADLMTTTRALTTTLLAYGQGADQAANYSNILTRTVQLGVGTMDNFANVLGTINPNAATLGVSFQEIGEGLAFLTQRGMNAATASTSLNSALTTLIKPGTQLQEVFARLGVVSGRELIDKFGGMEGAIEALYHAVGDRGDILAQMFTQRGARAVADIVNDLPGWAAFVQQFGDNLDSATSSARAEQLKAFAASFDLMKSAIQGAAIAIGEKLMPLVTPVMEFIKNTALSVEQANPGVIQLAVAFGVVAAAVGPLIFLFGALFTPIGLIAGAVAALALAFATNFGGINDVVKNFIATNVPALGTLVDAINKVFNLIVTPPTPQTATLPSYGQDTLQMNGGQRSVVGGEQTGGAASQAAFGEGMGFGEKLAAAIQTQLPTITAAFETLVGQIGSWILSTGIPLLSTQLGKLTGSLGNIIVDGINSALSFAWKLLSGEIDLGGGTSAIETYLQNNVGQPFKDGFEFTFDPSKLGETIDVGTKIGDLIKAKLAEVGTWISNGGLANVLQNIGTTLFTALASVFDTAGGTKLSLADKFVIWLSDLPNQLGTALRNIFAGGGDQYSVQDDIAGAVSGGTKFDIAFQSFITGISDWGTNTLLPSLVRAFSTAVGVFVGLIPGIILGINAPVDYSGLSTNISDKIGPAISLGFQQGLQSTTTHDQIQQALDSFLTGGQFTIIEGGFVDQLRDTVTTGFSQIGPGFQTMVAEPIKNGLANLKVGWDNFWVGIGTNIKLFWNNIQAFVIIGVGAFLQGIISGITGAISAAITAIKQIIGIALGGLLQLVNAVNNIPGVHIETSGITGAIASIAGAGAAPQGGGQGVSVGTQGMGRASGGPINGPRVVGEHGPEVFNPGTFGNIFNMNQMRDMFGSAARGSSSGAVSSSQNSVVFQQVSDVDTILFELKRRGIDLEAAYR